VARGPLRGEVWTVDLSATKGHEQDLIRPAVVVSADGFKRSAAGLVMVLPLTRTQRGIPFHVEVRPPEGGLRSTSYVLCDQIRTVAKERLGGRRGELAETTMNRIAERLRVLLDL
jgi:mRNA interferase MazF